MFLESMFPRMLLRSFGLFAAASLTGFLVAAGTLRKLTLDDCLQQAIEKNLGLRIARFDPRLASLSIHSAYSPYDPTLTAAVGQAFQVNPRSPYIDPSKFTPTSTSESWNDLYSVGLAGSTPTGLSYSFDAGLDRNGVTTTFTPTNKPSLSVQFSGFADTASLSLRQPLLKNFWIDSNRLNIILAKSALKQSVESLRTSLLELCLNIALNYYELIGAEENIEIEASAVELAERSLSENRLRVEIGSLAPLGEKQAEAQVASRRSNLISAHERYDRTATRSRVSSVMIWPVWTAWVFNQSAT